MKIERFDSLNENKNNRIYYVLRIVDIDEYYGDETILFDNEDEARTRIVNLYYNQLRDFNVDLEDIHNELRDYKNMHLIDLVENYNEYINEFDYRFKMEFYIVNIDNSNEELNKEFVKLIKLGPDNVKKIKNYNI